MSKKKAGIGAKILSNETWHGGCYCGICGSNEYVALAVRWWCPDTGWRVSVLCLYCFEDASRRPPREDDIAYDQKAMAEVVDFDAECDLDAAYATHYLDKG